MQNMSKACDVQLVKSLYQACAPEQYDAMITFVQIVYTFHI